ncbi:hypothetical protein [Bradyrhizobium sp. USDA 3315]
MRDLSLHLVAPQAVATRGQDLGAQAVVPLHSALVIISTTLYASNCAASTNSGFAGQRSSPIVGLLLISMCRPVAAVGIQAREYGARR